MKKSTVFSVVALSILPITAFGWGVELPLSVIPKNSMLGKGKVMVVTNISDEYLHECSVSVNKQQTDVAIPTLKPHESQNIGWLELGYELRAGDQIAINCKKYLTPFAFEISK